MKPRKLRFTATFVFAGAVSLLLGGCQSDARTLAVPDVVQPAPAASPSPVNPVGTPAESLVVYASPNTKAPEDFPLVPYWDAVRRGDEVANAIVSQEQLTKWWNTRESALVSCMKNKGFMFFPRPVHDTTKENEESVALDRDYLPIPVLPETRAEVEAVGYGVEPKVVEEKTDPPDKNIEYADSLSAKKASAYYIALEGVDITAPGYDPYNQPEELGGCGGKIERDYPTPGNDEADRNILLQHGDIVSDMASLTRSGQIYKDKQIVKLNRQWRSCMAGKGFAPDDPAREGGYWDGPYQAYMRAIHTDPSGKVGKITDDSHPLPDDQSRLVGSAAERKVALQDFDCREETNYLQTFTKTQRQQEQDFVNKNRKALDAMRTFVNNLS